MCFNLCESRLKRYARETLIKKLAFFDPIFPRFCDLIERNVNFELKFDKKTFKIEQKRKNYELYLML